FRSDRLIRDGARPRWLTVEILPVLTARGTAELDAAPAFRHTWGDVRFLAAHSFCGTAHALGWLGARAAPGYACRFTLMSRYLPAWVALANRQDHLWARTNRDGWQEPPALSVEQARAVRARA